MDGESHADEARTLLDQIVDTVAEDQAITGDVIPVTVLAAMAQVHATLAIAERLAVIDETLENLTAAVTGVGPDSKLYEMIAEVVDAIRSHR